MRQSRNETNRRYARKNREKHRLWNRQSYRRCRIARQAYLHERYEQRRAFIDKIKAVPCAVCGLEYPSYVMEFHHRNPMTKDFKISTSLVYYNAKVIMQEIAKCDILCANCHRMKEWGTQGLRRAA